jgi:hypothetical protein
MAVSEEHANRIWSGSLIGLVFLCVLVAFGMWGCPQYNAWRAGVAGSGEFIKAEQNRRIKVLEAQAMLDSAKLYRQAEVERARGVKEANDIIADGLKGHDEYLRYLWIEKVAGGAQREVIYVPTETGLPILEAGKRGGDVHLRCTEAEIAKGCKVVGVEQ